MIERNVVRTGNFKRREDTVMIDAQLCERSQRKVAPFREGFCFPANDVLDGEIALARNAFRNSG